MKVLFLLLVQVIVALCLKVVEPGQCLTGIVETGQPPVGTICPLNEVWGCGYGEPRCTPVFVCVTPPCHSRCWCAPGYKRNDAGVCVLLCPRRPLPPIKLPLEPIKVE